MKSEQNGRKTPTHPNPNVVQILKSVEKYGCSLTNVKRMYRTTIWQIIILILDAPKIMAIITSKRPYFQLEDYENTLYNYAVYKQYAVL